MKNLCKNLIMKIDVEGCEWDIFKEVESEVIGQFAQIIVEFHELTSTVYNQNYLAKTSLI